MAENLLYQLENAASETQIGWLFTQSLLDSLSPELAESVLAASIPHWFNTEILAVLLDVAVKEAEKRYLALQALQIAEPLSELGYALHDLTRSSILSHLVNEKNEQFLSWSRRAHEYFSKFADTQNQVEGLYHQLAVEGSDALRTFKERIRTYRNKDDFSSAHTLLRTARELVAIGRLDKSTSDELERQEYRIGRVLGDRISEITDTEKANDYFEQFSAIFKPASRTNRIADETPDNRKSQLSKFQLEYLNKRLEEASSPQDSNRQVIWLTEIADFETQQKDYEAALEKISRALELTSNDVEVIESRGFTYRLMERHNEALSDFNRAIELYPENVWAIGQRGEIYRSMKNYDDALSNFNRAIGLDPSLAWTIGGRGETYRLTERYDEALSDFNRAIELDPNYTWAIGNRGETYRLTERYDEALSDFNRAIELSPENVWAIGQRGVTYRLVERYDDALSDFNRAIKLDPESAWAIGQRGVTYYLMNRNDKALSDFDCAIELDPNLTWAIAIRATIYRLMERYDEALSEFNYAIKLDPKYAFISHRGETYRLMKRYEEALSDFNRAIELDPKNAWAVGRRGLIYSLMERYIEALSDFKRVIEFYS